MPHVRVRPRVAIALLAAVALALLVTEASVVAVVIAVLVGALLWKAGFSMIGGFAQPVPEPPPPGELRKVRNTYRCTICGTELRMTLANDEVPEPPRHCMEDMDLIATIDDAL